MNRFSPTYAAILDLLFRTKSIDGAMYSNEFDSSNGFSRTKLNSATKRVPQEITITTQDLFNMCTPAQWYLVGLICSQLKQYNALWECPQEVKKSGTNRAAIKGLIEMKVLIKTETPHIYLVNPLYIRRGGFYEVLVTTAETLANSVKVLPEHITNKKPVNRFKVPEKFRIADSGYGMGELFLESK